MKKLLSAIFFLSSLFGFSNGVDGELIWEENPSFSSVFPENAKEYAVGIFIAHNYEYVYSEEGDLQCINTIHKKIRLNTDEAVNEFNKLSVSLDDVIEIIELKARAIKPDGTVVNFDEENVKEITDDETGNNYKIFAIDGIKTGDDIEYYIVRRLGSLTESRCFFQDSYPIQHAYFKLTSPPNLLFASKGYNGFPNPSFTKQSEELNLYTCSRDSIKLIKAEKFSYVDPRRARVEWKLEYNLDRNGAPLLTWDDAAQTIYESYYVGVDRNQLTQWLEAIDVKNGSELEMAAQVEEYLKMNIYIQELSSPDFYDLDFVFKNQVTNVTGIVKIYARLFQEIGIEHELVVTSSRDKIKFDKDLQSYSYLDKYLIYLPASDSYIDPNSEVFRVGCVEGNLTATDGLFVTPVSFDGFESAIAKIKYIEPTSYLQNFDHLHIVMDIDVDEFQTRVKTSRGFKGLSGGYIRNFYDLADEEYQKDLLISVMPIEATYTEYKTIKPVKESKIDFIDEAEFIVFSDIESERFLEEAGDKILINVGETIGPQVEMYFEDEREAEIENSFNRSYYREILINIPDGYKISNPESADLSFIEEIDGNDQFGFVSQHSFEGTQYKIVIDEYYKQIFAGHEHIEGFKKVVNAAADFNKVVLILEKE